MAAGVVMVYLFVLIIAGVMGYYRKTPTRDEAPNPHNPQEACDKAIAALNAVHAQVCARDAAMIAGSEAALAQIERRKSRDNVFTTRSLKRALAAANLPPCS
jgi:hypothetical protein